MHDHNLSAQRKQVNRLCVPAEEESNIGKAFRIHSLARRAHFAYGASPKVQYSERVKRSA